MDQQSLICDRRLKTLLDYLPSFIKYLIMPLVQPDKNGKIRDANGRFVSKNTPPEKTTGSVFTTDGPDLAAAKSTLKDPLDAPLVSVTVQNPFKKLLHWLDTLRKKQTTTFNFKISIPLIALPIFLVVIGSAFSFFFNLGKSSVKSDSEVLTPTVTMTPSIATQRQISKVGVIKATYQSQPTPAESSSSATQNPYRFVLSVSSTQFIFLNPVSGIVLSSYLNQRVLVTGLYDEKANSLKINNSSDIEILP